MGVLRSLDIRLWLFLCALLVLLEFSADTASRTEPSRPSSSRSWTWRRNNRLAEHCGQHSAGRKRCVQPSFAFRNSRRARLNLRRWERPKQLFVGYEHSPDTRRGQFGHSQMGPRAHTWIKFGIFQRWGPALNSLRRLQRWFKLWRNFNFQSKFFLWIVIIL